MPNFEVLDARIAFSTETESSIILTSKEESVCRNKRTQKQDRFLRGRQIAYLIYEYFRVPGANDSVENYAELVSIVLRNDDIQEFDSKMGRNFVNDENPIWWHLGKVVQTKNTRIWETSDRIGIVWLGDSSEEVRTWLSQIEDNGEKKCRTQHFRNKEFWRQKWKL